ncbi:MAG TPA: ComF family protein [Victivallales bacterium]|nr:ComF family protein [Victivallales bacterium]
MKIVKQIIGQFVPTICPLCLNQTTENNYFCADCLNDFSFIGDKRCSSCGSNLDLILNICSKCLKEEPFPWNNALSVIELKGYANEIIQKLKYNNRIDFVPYISRLASDLVIQNKLKFDYIVPIPLHKLKKLIRGFNQSYLISQSISKTIKIPCKEWLIREKYTISQTRLSSKMRRKNIINVFSSSKRAIIKNKDILLVDDVMTTGSTLRSAANQLLSAGAKQVSILVIARR